MAARLPALGNGVLRLADGKSVHIGSAEWAEWLASADGGSFTWASSAGTFTIRRERKGQMPYWYAYHTHHGKLHKRYVGRARDVTLERLNMLAASVAGALPSSEVTLFGSPLAERAGKTVPLPAKAFGLLAYLAAHPTPQPRERLTALLWPESDGEAARKNMRNLLWHMRAALGPEALRTGDLLALAAGTTVDLRVFAEAPPDRVARTRARLYRGPLLDGVVFTDAPDLELWLIAAREHAHEQHLAALHELIARQRAGGRWAQVLALARTALAHDPLQEPMYRALIEAYARLGDRAAALRQYALLRDMLDRELGMEPLPETDALRDAILRGDALAPMPAAPVALPDARSAAPPPPMIGRAAALNTLDAAWQAAQQGQPQLALLRGEAGIGKSHLWRSWSFRQRVPALAASCLAATTHLPFFPLTDMLGNTLVRQRLADAAPATPIWLTDLARLIPDLRESWPQLPPPRALPPAEEQRRVFEALVRGLGIGPDQPLVLFFDDIHWADQATLDWLGFVRRRAEHAPLLVVLACRLEDATPALDAVLEHWGRASALHRITLERLNRDETAHLIQLLHGDVRRSDTLYAQSDGNPFFLTQLLATEPGEMPAAVTDLIQQRLQALSDVTRQMLQAATLIQPALTFDMLLATSGRDEAETLDALDTLVAAGLLADDGRAYRFSHPLIPTVIERGIGSARRLLFHRRAAAALEPLLGNSVEDAGQLAWHLSEAGDHERAAQFAAQAGARSLAVAAPVEAVYFYQQAVSLHPLPIYWYGLGLARYRQGQLELARAALAEAETRFAQAGDRRGAARASLEIARSYLASSDASDVVVWVQRGRAHLAGDTDTAAQALAAYLLGAELRAVGVALDDAAAHLEEAIRLSRHDTGSTILAGALLELGNTHAQQGDLDAALHAYADLVQTARMSGDQMHEVIGLNNAAYHTLLQGDIVQARQLVEEGLARAHQYDLELAYQWLLSTSGEIALAAGDLPTAETALRQAHQHAERMGNTSHALGIRAHLALVARAQGDYARARHSLEDVQRNSAALPFLAAQVALWRAETAHMAGNVPAARAALADADAILGHHSYALLRRHATVLRHQMGDG